MDRETFEERLKTEALYLEFGDGQATFRLQREVSADGGIHYWAGPVDIETYYDANLFEALINLVHEAGWYGGKEPYFAKIANGKPANM